MNDLLFKYMAVLGLEIMINIVFVIVVSSVIVHVMSKRLAIQISDSKQMKILYKTLLFKLLSDIISLIIVMFLGCLFEDGNVLVTPFVGIYYLLTGTINGYKNGLFIAFLFIFLSAILLFVLEYFCNNNSIISDSKQRIIYSAVTSLLLAPYYILLPIGKIVNLI